jgi:DNA-binding LytR/AlgR family response regulator
VASPQIVQSEPRSLVGRIVDLCERQRRSLIVAVIAAGFMSAIGAFDSRRLPPLNRFVFWEILMLGGTLLAIAVMSAVRRLHLLDERPWMQATLMTLLLWAPACVMTWLMIGVMSHGDLALANLVNNAGAVLLVSAAMTALNYLADRSPPQTHAAAEPGAAPPTFLERLPIRLRGAELYAVEAEDHYLRLHTSKGADLILMRLSDAIEELEGIEGAQTHRSWWVARDGVDDARRADGRATIRLKDGAEVPVSRTFVRALRQAGWF